MAFEIINPQRSGAEIYPGQASINKSGYLTITKEDAAMLGIQSATAVLVDKELRRIGIRSPMNGEPIFDVTYTPTRARICIGRAISELGALRSIVAGRYELNMDGILAYIVLK